MCVLCVGGVRIGCFHYPQLVLFSRYYHLNTGHGGSSGQSGSGEGNGNGGWGHGGSVGYGGDAGYHHDGYGTCFAYNHFQVKIIDNNFFYLFWYFYLH